MKYSINEIFNVYRPTHSSFLGMYFRTFLWFVPNFVTIGSVLLRMEQMFSKLHQKVRKLSYFVFKSKPNKIPLLVLRFFEKSCDKE